MRYLNGALLTYLRCPPRVYRAFFLPFSVCNSEGQTRAKLLLRLHCFQDNAEAFAAWGVIRWRAHWSPVSQNFRRSTVLANIFFSDVSLVFSNERIISNLGFMGLCSLQYIGISRCTWEMTCMPWLFNHPLNTNENRLSCHSSSTWLHRSKRNSHTNVKGYGKVFSMLHHFETAISPCAIRPKPRYMQMWNTWFHGIMKQD